MILEQLPEVQKLPDAVKRQLAEELWQAAGEGDAIEVDPAVIALLEARLADYAANPNAVSSWHEVEARVFQRHGV
jgi:putative addiction module component (TIGR02574 family)